MQYSLVMRGNPRYPERGQKVYASAQSTKTLSLNEFIDSIMQHGSSYSRGDYKAIISTLAEAMAEMMAEGYRIDLAEMGKFYPTLDCNGADTMAEFNPDKHIKSVKVNWEPGDDFKNLKDKITFREDLTRRLQKDALKADMERWNKEGE